MENVTSEQRNIAVVAHLATFAHAIVPFSGLVVPLFLMFARPNEEFTKRHAAESLNFNLSFLLWVSLAAVSILGWIFLPALLLIGLICPVVAAIQASRGSGYQYPLTLRLFS